MLIACVCTVRTRVCVNAGFRSLQAKKRPLLQHGSPSRLLWDASHILPSSFSSQHAKLDDLEAGEGPGVPGDRASAPGFKHAPVTAVPGRRVAALNPHQCHTLSQSLPEFRPNRRQSDGLKPPKNAN